MHLVIIDELPFCAGLLHQSCTWKTWSASLAEVCRKLSPSENRCGHDRFGTTSFSVAEPADEADFQTPTAKFLLYHMERHQEREIEIRPFLFMPIYLPIQPPSTVRISPLMYPLARLARNTTLPLKSSGVPHLAAGILARMLSALA